LSLVKITFRCRNHIKTLIFNGTFIFQMYFFKYFVSSSKKSKYMDLTVKTPLVIKPHTKTCFSLLSWTTISRCTSCNHNLHRFFVKVRQKVMFSGVLFSTLAMVTCLRCTML
jgi:hypothetical protein